MPMLTVQASAVAAYCVNVEALRTQRKVPLHNIEGQVLLVGCPHPCP